jgi:hypothetical protein
MINQSFNPAETGLRSALLLQHVKHWIALGIFLDWTDGGTRSGSTVVFLKNISFGRPSFQHDTIDC